MIGAAVCKGFEFQSDSAAGDGWGGPGLAPDCNHDGGLGSGAGNSISLGGHTAATTASDATPNGGALACVGMVGLSFQTIEDCIGSPPNPGIAGQNRANGP
jgi:hypothetical protein